MINPLLITLHPVVHCAWLIFESINTSVLGGSDRFRVAPIAGSSLALRVPVIPLNSPPTALHLSQTLAGSTRLDIHHQPSLQSP